MTTIMVVDDLPIVREPIAAALHEAGYETVTACDGRDALGKILEKVPQLVVLDLTMPEVDGIGFLTAVRGNPTLRGLPVILLTDVSDREKIVQVAKLGVQDYLLKSRFSLGDLLRRIEKCIGAAGEIAQTAAAVGKAPAEGRGTVAAPAGVRQTATAKGVGAKAAPPPSQWPVLLTREKTLERLDDVAGSKTMAGVVSQVVALASSPRADLSDIVSLISKDPIIASRFLQLAN
jgi:two-component system chemotaxis response regulator CheY